MNATYVYGILLVNVLKVFSNARDLKMLTFKVVRSQNTIHNKVTFRWNKIAQKERQRDTCGIHVDIHKKKVSERERKGERGNKNITKFLVIFLIYLPWAKRKEKMSRNFCVYHRWTQQTTLANKGAKEKGWREGERREKGKLTFGQGCD